MPKNKIQPMECEIIAYSGGFTVKLPEWIVRNLTSPGEKDRLARRYANKLIGFRERFDREMCIELLLPYGAWDEEEFAKMTTRQIQNILLWVVAGNEPAEYGRGYVTCYIGD